MAGIPHSKEPLDARFSTHRKTALLVGDASAFTGQVRPILDEMDMHVESSSDSADADRLLRMAPVDLILLDLDTAAGDDATACVQLLKANSECSAPLLVLAGQDGNDQLLEALRAGADDFIRKPAKAFEVLIRIRTALYAHSWQEHAKKSRERVAIITQIMYGMNMGLEPRDAIPPVLTAIANLVNADLSFLIPIDEDGARGDPICPTVVDSTDDVSVVDLVVEDALESNQPQQTVAVPDAGEDILDDAGQGTPRGYRSALVIPLADRDEVIGLLALARHAPLSFTRHDIDSLAVVCDTLAISTSRARWLKEIAESHRIIQHEMEMLGRVQELLLPQSLPEYEGLEFRAFYQPAQEAGGDYYDVIQLTDTDIAIIVADVSGHGAPAAMNMGIARSILHTVSLSQQTSPKQTIYLLNKLLCRLLGEDAYITMFYGVLSLEHWTFRWTSAGHVPGMVYRTSQSKTEVIAEESDGYPMGWWTTSEYEESCITLDPGDFVLLYTDGLIEAIDRSGQELTVEGVQAVLDSTGTADLDDALRSLLSAFERHVEGGHLDDDVTLLAFRRRG